VSEDVRIASVKWLHVEARDVIGWTMIAITHTDIGTHVRAHEAAARKQARREHVWAWLSLVTLLLCWDACLRLDHRVSLPRPRLAHAIEREQELREELIDK
jgi:hypothetical protein